MVITKDVPIGNSSSEQIKPRYCLKRDPLEGIFYPYFSHFQSPRGEKESTEKRAVTIIIDEEINLRLCAHPSKTAKCTFFR